MAPSGKCCMASRVGLLLLSIFKKFPFSKTCSMGDKLVFSWQLPSYSSPNSWPPSDPTAPTSYPAWTIFLSPVGNYILRKGKRSLGSCLRDLHVLQQEIKTGAHQLANYLVIVNRARAVQTDSVRSTAWRGNLSSRIKSKILRDVESIKFSIFIFWSFVEINTDFSIHISPEFIHYNWVHHSL